jgi:CHAT domain-containing protein
LKWPLAFLVAIYALAVVGLAEGLSGLAKAFFYAGARSLLMSHWPVDSAATVKLTTGAFHALESDSAIGRAEAFRRAVLAMIDGAGKSTGAAYEAHPLYRAPFVVVGERGSGRRARRGQVGN